MSEKSIVTELQLIEGYKFQAKSDLEYFPDLIVDEAKPEGTGAGLNPPRLLSIAVGHCLSSSLVYCLKKARIPIIRLETIVKTNLFRNKKGRRRVRSIGIQIDLQVNEEDNKRLPRCLNLFEDYCTVTQSIRNGILVNVNVK